MEALLSANKPKVRRRGDLVAFAAAALSRTRGLSGGVSRLQEGAEDGPA